MSKKKNKDEQARERRRVLAEQFAQEVKQWPAKKLRGALAQPDIVRAAEEREAAQACVRAMAALAPQRPSLRAQISQAALTARDNLMSAGVVDIRTLATACNEAFARVGIPGNNDTNDLTQIAALTLAMAECAALKGDKVA